jgi:hypothetical protein
MSPPADIGDELALRAGADPAWDAVLAAWIAGRGWRCSRLPHNVEHAPR